jgi:hypothetical protein
MLMITLRVAITDLQYDRLAANLQKTLSLDRPLTRAEVEEWAVKTLVHAGHADPAKDTKAPHKKDGA